MNPRVRKIVATFLTMIFTLNFGCGAIIHGTKQDIQISSIPSKADVTIMGEKRVTPATISLKRKGSYIVRIEKEGYETAEVSIQHSISGVAWLGLLLGVIPLFIDFGTGGAYKLKPEVVSVTLSRKSGASLGTTPEAVYVQVEKKGQSLKATSSEPVRISIIEVE